jgi:hypothetical protein
MLKLRIEERFAQAENKVTWPPEKVSTRYGA